jgi:hypothetical protein
MKKNPKGSRLKEEELYKFLERRPENTHELFFLVREFILKNNPETDEKLKWGVPAYIHKGLQTNYIMVNKSHITFGFMMGNHLKDPQKLLEGVGKNLRHVKITKPGDLKNKDLVLLYKEALKYAEAISAE